MTESNLIGAAIAASLPEPGKAQNQDCQVSGTFGPDSDPTHLLVVADGVSSSPLAARASRVACDAMMAGGAALAVAAPTDLGDLLAGLVGRANTAMREVCQGRGLASLVAAVVRPKAEMIYVVSVGDSGIYLSEPSDFRILTRPDRAVRIRKEGARVLIKDGLPIIDRGLSRALGSHEGIRIEAKRIEPWPRSPSWLCLASDGVPWPHFQGFIEGLTREGKPLDHGKLLAFVDEMRRYTEDDATALVLQIP